MRWREWIAALNDAYRFNVSTTMDNGHTFGTSDFIYSVKSNGRDMCNHDLWMYNFINFISNGRQPKWNCEIEK